MSDERHAQQRRIVELTFGLLVAYDENICRGGRRGLANVYGDLLIARQLTGTLFIWQ
jgi:hypothetical protein